MFSSTIIATVGRPTLARAVGSVVAQSLDADDFEVIVVNDSGVPLPPASWQDSGRVRVIDTCRRERSVARNTGAAVARGQYLHFLDDDDWLLPNALRHLRGATRSSSAAWIYGQSELVTADGTVIQALRHTLAGNCFVQAVAGEWIPLQASVVEAATFFAVGGFNPRISGPEDNDILRRVTLQSAVAGTPEIVARITWRTASSTTDYGRHPHQSRWAREYILGQPEAWSRMRASAASPYWQGRIVRAYATSAAWNTSRRRFFVAASRATAGVAALMLAGAGALSSTFWRAVARPHAGVAFAEGLRERGV